MSENIFNKKARKYIKRKNLRRKIIGNTIFFSSILLILFIVFKVLQYYWIDYGVSNLKEAIIFIVLTLPFTSWIFTPFIEGESEILETVHDFLTEEKEYTMINNFAYKNPENNDYAFGLPCVRTESVDILNTIKRNFFSKFIFKFWGEPIINEEYTLVKKNSTGKIIAVFKGWDEETWHPHIPRRS